MFVDQKTERVTIPLNESTTSNGWIELANSNILGLGVC